MSSVEHLRSYYPFDDAVINRIEEVAHGQKGLSWPEYAAKHDIPHLINYEPRTGKRIEVLDIIPYDYDETLVYHQPMACRLDSNRQIHVATLAASAPTKRIISVSNPGTLFKGTSKIRLRDMPKVWGGDLQPAVEPTLEYINEEQIEATIHIGESYGSEKAAAAASHAWRYDQEVVHTIMTEPIRIAERGLINVARAFQQTSAHGDKYLGPVRELSQTFISAEDLKDSMALFAAGLLSRPSNIVIGKALGRSGFEEQVSTALDSQPEMKAEIIWGEKSELALNGLVFAASERLKAKYGEDRVGTMQLIGQTHAMNLDPFLNSAIILQATLRRTGEV